MVGPDSSGLGCNNSVPTDIDKVKTVRLRRDEMTLLTRMKSHIQKPIAVLVVVSVVITTASIAGTLMLQTRFDQSWQEANLLLTASAEIHELSALEWQAVAEGGIDESLAAEIDATQANIESMLTEVANDGGEGGVVAAYAVYRVALANEFEALRAGELETAKAIDEEQVDPAFEALHAIVEEEALEHADKARFAGKILNVGTGALIAAAFTLIGYLTLRHERSVRALNASLERKVAERTADLEVANDELQTLYRDARDRASKDPLTGLFNHRHYQEATRDALADAVESGESLGLVVMDIDNFKLINDTLGHLQGDQALRHVAEALRGSAGNALLFRPGGDEFAVMLPGADTKEAIHVAEQIRAAVSNDPRINATVSLGVAAYPGSARTAEELMHGADASMYWAKSLGRNRVMAWDQLLQRNHDGDIPWYATGVAARAPEVVGALIEALAAKDPATRDHVERCSRYSLAIAEELGLGADQSSRVRLASLLHDIGKIHIREEVLNKPGPLSGEEWEHMRQHPVIALQILGQVRSVADATAAILHHHEHYDGSGYPDGLAGEAIPLISRILMVSDAFDAMTTDRPYRKAIPAGEAIDELRRYSGTQFDPTVVEAFLTRFEGKTIESIREGETDPAALPSLELLTSRRGSLDS